ncbi:hypothetical protein ACFRH6_16890 [Streptomyces sp. NPDC056749]|uniref:hypothetical protein n=1 Tax=Streptomyces sp. NPDC056749 TaxID=3345936 RepID=UPI0036AE145A
MISARLRYAALVLAGATFAVLGFLYAAAGHPTAVALCLALTGACWEACSWTRRAAEQLQDLERAARPAPAPHPLSSPCCEPAFLTVDAVHSETCRGRG